MKQSFAEILQQVERRGQLKLEAKIPSWAGAGTIAVPSALNLEQCSSEDAAMLKAELVGPCGSLADLTGGLGVDSWAFSKVARKVLHIERNEELSAAAASNFSKLGISNIETLCATTDTALVEGLPSFDWIYIDPARRDNAGRKVFLLEDCTPDVLTLLPSIWKKTSSVMIKLSPMADISLIARKLGQELEKVYVACLGGEVKELLCILHKGHTGGYGIGVRLLAAECPALEFLPEDEENAEAVHDGIPQAGQYINEPCAGLLKAGAFRLPCSLWGLRKMDRSTHLYLSDGPLPASARPWFRSYRILRAEVMGAAAIKDIAKAFPRADVSARNIPMTSEQLRAKLKCAPSTDGTHIFGCSGSGKRWLVICRADTSSRI